MRLVEIKKEEFNNIAEKFACKNFFQTSNMAATLEKRGKNVYYLGLLDNTKIVAATILYESGSFLGKKIFNSLKGFLVDYTNIEIVREFSNKLIEFVKNHNGFKLIIDPYVMLQERDIDGNIIENGKDNYFLVNLLKEMGFKKSKVDTQVRFNFCLDYNGKNVEDIMRDFKPTTRNLINKAIREGVEIFDLSYDELPSFKKITEYTSRKRDFFDKSLEYYQMMYEEFKNEVVFKMARLNVNKHREYLNNKKSEFLDKLVKTNNEKRKENYQLEINNLDKKLNKLENLNINKGYIDLAVGMFMLYGDETIYLFSGSLDEYMEYGGQYLIQWDIIKYGIEHHYKRHNFFGIIDFQNKDSKEYGIYLFKRGFNGYVEELLGEYYYNIKSIPSIIYNLKSLIRGGK